MTSINVIRARICRALAPLLEDIADASLLAPPANVLRLSLHPAGLAPRIANLHDWRRHLIARLRRQINASGDPTLAELERELLSYPGAPPTSWPTHPATAAIAHPLQLRLGAEILSFISTITVFGTPIDVTLSELAIESFFPADPETAGHLQKLAAERSLSRTESA